MVRVRRNNEQQCCPQACSNKTTWEKRQGASEEPGWAEPEGAMEVKTLQWALCTAATVVSLWCSPNIHAGVLTWETTLCYRLRRLCLRCMLYCTAMSDEVIYDLGRLRWDEVNKNVYTVMLNIGPWLFSQESSVKFLSVPLPHIFILIPQQQSKWHFSK